MPAPNLPMLLKRLALTQMGIAQHFANPQFHDGTQRNKLLQESQAIAADLQTFTDHYRIEVTPRKASYKQPCSACGQ